MHEVHWLAKIEYTKYTQPQEQPPKDAPEPTTETKTGKHSTFRASQKSENARCYS